jgi:protein N-terminal methyltransferase
MSINSHRASVRAAEDNNNGPEVEAKSNEINGTEDSEDNQNIATDNNKRQRRWYREGAKYWETQEATVNGVLGGFGHLSPVDIDSSKEFLLELDKSQPVTFGRAIDCGAGVGRIAEKLLCALFSQVDLVEQNAAYVEKARETIKHKHMNEFHVAGLQDFDFGVHRYDCIWIQWVIGHLTDKDFVAFMQRCIKGLKPNGVICLKENNSKDGFVFDNQDSSITRSDQLFKLLFKKSGLTLVHEQVQQHFPKALFTVKMYALKPNNYYNLDGTIQNESKQ